MSDLKSLSHSPSTSPVILGIGASAGGLDACRALLSAFPREAGFAVILVVHLDPHHQSVMAELLDKNSSLRVHQAQNGQRVEVNHVYVVPPNVLLGLSKGNICLTPLKKPDKGRRIDCFLQSLAKDQGQRAVGAVLTGMGSDGTVGLRAIKEAGGLTLVQDPDTAEHDGMPRSALAGGCADHCLALSAMPQALSDHLSRLTTMPTRSQEKGLEAGATLEAICDLPGRELQHDFSQYKKSTLMRRISRRMLVRGSGSLEDYARVLDEDSAESHSLLRELLVSVTGFFRDPECFQALSPIVDQMVAEANGRSLRVWVPACATGEEAYSIGILFAESFRRAARPNDVKIFATDIDQAALTKARKGCYPAGIAEAVTQERLQSFFLPHGDRYEVKPELRAMCLFSRHNLVSDPPFSRLDLISCRNLLIYFRSELQTRTIKTFHYALNPGGFLQLGKAESMGEHSNLFREVEQPHRLYQALGGQPPRLSTILPSEHYGRKKTAPRVSEGADLRASLVRFILPKIDVTIITVDGSDRVLDMCGSPDRYVAHRSGGLEDKLFLLARPELVSPLRNVVRRSRTEGAETAATVKDFPTKGKRLEIGVFPYAAKFQTPECWVVVFQESISHGKRERGAEAPTDLASDTIVRQLEDELEELRERLGEVTAQLENHIEELHSSNEEMTATNEELQGTNEELETSKEEIQSTNQELLALNGELEESALDRARAHADLFNHFSSHPNPTVFLDRELNIRQFTASSKEVFRLLAGDAERPITDIASRLGPLDYRAHCEQVLETSKPFDVRLLRPAGDLPLGYYRLRILPYRSLDSAVDGLVLSYTDVTEAETAKSVADHRARLIASVAKISILAPKDESLEEFSAKTLQEICEVLSMEVASFHRLLAESREMELVHGIGWQGAERTPLLDDDSVVGHALLAGKPVAFSDLNGVREPGNAPLLIQEGLRSGITASVLHEDGPYGVLGVYGKEAREFSPDEVDFMESMASLLGTALAHRRDSFVRALEKVVISTLSTSTDLLEALAYELGASVCELWLFETGSDQLTCTAVNQVSEDRTAISGVGLIGEVWRQKEPVWVTDLATSSLFFPSDEAKRRHLMSGFAVPLLSAGKARGVLSCFFPKRVSSSRRLIAALKAAGSAIGEFLRRTEAEIAL